ncbi:MAG TPA: flagellar basal body-associated FliL family protein [Burkholderiaceae bacterium]
MPPPAAAAVAAARTAEAEASAPRRRVPAKKLIVLVAGALLLLTVLGGAGLFVMKKRAAAAAAAEGVEPAAAHEDRDHARPPTYVPLDAFTVNLADTEAERFAQVGVTFEVDDEKAAERVKAFMPSIRNAILLLLTHKTSADLAGRPGKEQLAREIRRESTRAMGYDVPDEPAPGAGAAPRPNAAEPIGPIRRVNFASFIIQ